MKWATIFFAVTELVISFEMDIMFFLSTENFGVEHIFLEFDDGCQERFL